MIAAVLLKGSVFQIRPRHGGETLTTNFISTIGSVTEASSNSAQLDLTMLPTCQNKYPWILSVVILKVALDRLQSAITHRIDVDDIWEKHRNKFGAR